MKKIARSLSLIAVGLAGFTANASAQRPYDDRPSISIPVPRVVAREIRDNRVARELDELNYEVRRVRLEIRAAGGGGRRIRYEFHRVVRATDRLNAGFRRGVYGRREVRVRAQQIRAELYRIQRDLRVRGSRRGWR
ncbi:MAG: hypothetical protein H0W20_02035 [Chthoniobacterales bacterium]|nr:hypothetical protein [Chthoniobacterales bacterium]